METNNIKLSEKEMFEEWLELRKLSPRTIKEYLLLFNKFGGCGRFTQNNVDNFIRKHNNPSGRSLINNLKQFIKRTYNTVNFELIDITQPTGRKSEKIPKFVTEEEAVLMSNSAKTERDALIILIIFYGGLRAQGLLNIKPYDFNWEVWIEDKDKIGKLIVTEKGNKQRQVFIPSLLMFRIFEWINDYAGKKDDNAEHNLFQSNYTHKLSYQYLNKIIENTSMKAIGRRVTPHSLRHGCATWLLSKGWSLHKIQHYLGHKSIVTTQIYAHLDMKELEEDYPA